MAAELAHQSAGKWEWMMEPSQVLERGNEWDYYWVAVLVGLLVDWMAVSLDCTSVDLME